MSQRGNVYNTEASRVQKPARYTVNMFRDEKDGLYKCKLEDGTIEIINEKLIELKINQILTNK